ncbi:MAG: hypothetical protein H6739_01155 [Alphaproteobacteria bacterium]|nr:hypothetical protein [Alphaproteobacteria bacterium]
MDIGIAVTRHLIWDAASRVLRGARWEGLDEADTVDLAQRFLMGLGYRTYKEVPYPQAHKTRADLVGYSPLPQSVQSQVWVEVKRLFDLDLRLYKKRFDEGKRELLEDFERLAELDRGSVRAALWVVFSEHDRLSLAGSPSEARYSIQEAIHRIGEELSLASPTTHHVDLDDALPGLDAQPYARHLHVIAWRWDID